MWYIIIGLIVIIIAIVAVFATWVYVENKTTLYEEELNEQYAKEYNERKEKLLHEQYYRDLKLENEMLKNNEEERITGFAEPVGMWSKKILEEQSHSYLSAVKMLLSKGIGKLSNVGRWELTVKAKSLMGSQGKNRGRGR